jgi:hypothetical protein
MASRAPGAKGLRRDGALTEEQAREIIRLRKERKPLAEIAAAYRVTPGMVSHIARGRRWAYLHNGPDLAHGGIDA